METQGIGQLNYRGIFLRIDKAGGCYLWEIGSTRGYERTRDEAIRAGKDYIDLKLEEKLSGQLIAAGGIPQTPMPVIRDDRY